MDPFKKIDDPSNLFFYDFIKNENNENKSEVFNKENVIQNDQ